MALRLGIWFDGFADTNATLAAGQAAVEAGVSSLWMAEHLGYREAAVICTALALKTQGAMVVPTAVMPYLWHPTPVAMQFATMAEAFPGRVGIAVALGNPLFLGESGVEPTKPVRAIRDYVEALRGLWSGEPVHMQGHTFTLRGARLAFTPPQPIPIFVATTGPQILTLAGRIADGVLFSAGQSLPYTKKCAAFVDAGVAEAGRQPSDVRRASFVFFACTKDGKTALESNRRKIAFLFRNKALRENIESIGVPIDHDAIIEAVRRRDLEAAKNLIPLEAVPRFSIAGTPQDCREQLQAYIDAGVDEPVIEVSGSDEEKRLALAVIREFTGGR